MTHAETDMRTTSHPPFDPSDMARASERAFAAPSDVPCVADMYADLAFNRRRLVITLRDPAELRDYAISPSAAFVFSRADAVSSLEDLIDACGLSTSTVTMAVAELVGHGILRVVAEEDVDGAKPTVRPKPREREAPELVLDEPLLGEEEQQERRLRARAALVYSSVMHCSLRPNAPPSFEAIDHLAAGA